MTDRIGSLVAPDVPDGLPSDVKWLSGEGGGTWFHIKVTSDENKYIITRFSVEGVKECERPFEVEQNGETFDINKAFIFTHISHCAKCRIKQGSTVFTFNYINT